MARAARRAARPLIARMPVAGALIILPLIAVALIALIALAMAFRLVAAARQHAQHSAAPPEPAAQVPSA